MALKSIIIILALSTIAQNHCLCRHVKRSVPIRSDVIVTKFGPEIDETASDQDEAKPGWMRRQLIRFGDITSRVSNKLGGSAMKVAGIVEKLCKLLKTVIPIVAAVCTVGQFQFCTSADAPSQLSEAMSGSNPMNLSIPDK